MKAKNWRRRWKNEELTKTNLIKFQIRVNIEILEKEKQFLDENSLIFQSGKIAFKNFVLRKSWSYFLDFKEKLIMINAKRIWSMQKFKINYAKMLILMNK